MNLGRKRRSSTMLEIAMLKAQIINGPKCRKRLSFDLDTVLRADSTSNSATHEQEPISVHTNTSDIADLTVNPSDARCPNNASELSNKVLSLASANTNISNDETFLINDTMVHEFHSLNYTETDAETQMPGTSGLAIDNDLNVTLTIEPEAEESSLNDLHMGHQSQQHYTQSPTSFCNLSSLSAGPNKDPIKSNSTRSKVGEINLRKHIINYIDYMSDQEDFSTFYGELDDSDNWTEGQHVTEESEASVKSVEKKGKKNKKYTKKKSETTDEVLGNDEEKIVGELALRRKKPNLRKERSRNKISGQEYTKRTGEVIPAKKVLPNPCIGKKCGNECGCLTEERRENLFKHFWNLSQERRRDWLVSMSQKVDIKRKRTSSEKRNYTFKYFINEGEGRRFVCQQFLAATLNICDKTIYNIVKNANWGSAKEDMRGKCEPPNKTKETTIDGLKRFIKQLPAVPSHYCRQDSTKVYLPQEFKNVSNLYKIYKKHHFDQSLDVVSERIFRKVFQENFNIGFHVPKKDKCLKCLQFENNLEKEKEKKEHEIEKQESYERFKIHKSIHKKDPTTLCASFDLEKVLNTPYAQSMLLYYSRKLAVYNFCVYENGTRNVFCYYWDESHGKRGANEIATILNKYIQTVDDRENVKRLLLYCDCCPGQNRNRTVLAMLHASLKKCKNIDTIQINFLLTGHTYMPVDTVHAIIENRLKNTTVYAPSQWYTIFSTARQDPAPFNVDRLNFEDFYKWDSVSDKYFKGNLTGKISKIRVMTFKKDKNAKYKMSMNPEAKTYDVEVQTKAKLDTLVVPCYRSRLSISKAKYDDLEKLCADQIIPNCFRHEYMGIPRTTTVPDTLPESDIEDGDLN